MLQEQTWVWTGIGDSGKLSKQVVKQRAKEEEEVISEGM